MSDHEKLADDGETDFLFSRQAIARCVAFAAHRTLTALKDGAEDAGTGQLADLAYAFACLEGARRGVLPGTPPPPKDSAPAAIPPKRPTSSSESTSFLPPFGDTTRTNR